MQKTIFGFSLLTLISVSHSSINPSDLIKVNKESNPQCVEYYNYKGDTYCSTKRLQTNGASITEAIRNSEKQNIVFDNRVWQAAWGKQDNTITTIEYLPAGDNIDDWKELITTQFIPNGQKPITPKDYLELILNNFKQAGLNPKITIWEQTPKQIIFEFQVTSPTNLQQDELQKITETPKGLYLLHYVMKQSDMGQDHRQGWLNNLKASSIK
ncbi:Uncharacterised protein [Legionella busanensis]|uniref:Uncharacterized protein n=1 Tax=Legionella busanensis TaxID=190655 RepID=A0A378JMD8_9GAMM|nr:hypothetical protein [Legionella busanensis]STX51901.1 Uncharacterised protein [Legionella busanensis]